MFRIFLKNGTVMNRLPTRGNVAVRIDLNQIVKRVYSDLDDLVSFLFVFQYKLITFIKYFKRENILHFLKWKYLTIIYLVNSVKILFIQKFTKYIFCFMAFYFNVITFNSCLHHLRLAIIQNLAHIRLEYVIEIKI